MTAQEILHAIEAWQEEHKDSLIMRTDHLWKTGDWATFLFNKGYKAFAAGVVEGAGINNWFSLSDCFDVTEDYGQNIALFAEWIASDPKLESKLIAFIKG